MEFVNNTPYEAELIHGPEGPERHGVVVIAKQTLTIGPDADEDLIWPVNREDQETDYGAFPFDHHFPSARMDVMVCGEAHPPPGRGARVAKVGLRVGDFQYHQHIYGDRVWRKRGFGYKPTDPEPFQTMPLVLGRAFGGKVLLKNGEISCLENPEGKGYLVKGLDPEGKPLPNIERPGESLEDPFGMPRPTCMAPYPLGWKLRLDPLMKDGELEPFSIENSHYYFGHAHPDLMIPRAEPSTEVRLSGMHPSGDLEFAIPESPLRARLIVDGETRELKVSLNALCIFAHKARAGLKYRAAGTFPLEPRQIRQVVLEEVPS
jgi:hypothetical protein